MESGKMAVSLALAGACLALVSCATDESINREASVQLEPAAVPPTPAVGEEFRVVNKGSPQLFQVMTVEGDLITTKIMEGARQGCSWTRGIGDYRFAPSVSWENCRNGSTGTQKISKSGNIWPLTVGSSESYKVKGKDQKYDWSTTRNCEVEAAVLVAVQGTEYPTYEVVCKDKWMTRTWHYAPELRRMVKYKGVHKRRGVDDDSVAVLE